jgi:peptide/nickel transport system permease protein
MRGIARFVLHWQNLTGLAIVAGFIFLAAAAPLLAPPDPGREFSPYREVKDLKGNLPMAPSSAAVLGTIPTGILRTQWDVFYTLVWGTRSALKFGVLAALGTAILGVLIGALSAFWGGWVNTIIMRITDSFLAFPFIVGVVLFQQLLSVVEDFAMFNYFEQQAGPKPLIISPIQVVLRQVDPVLLALVLFSWMAYARLTNSRVLGLKHTEFIEAARAMGASGGRIILRHLIPNSVSPAIVLAARDIGGMVLMQATLTFIGIGGGSEWGEILATGRRWIIAPGGNPLTYWWVFVPVTLAPAGGWTERLA